MDCQACEFRCPPLSQENTEAWVWWAACSTQWRAGPSGAIGLDYPACFQVAAVMDIDTTEANFRRIQALERETLKHMRKDNGNGLSA